MHILFSLLILLFLSTNAYPQDDPGRFIGQRITSVKVISATGITEEDIERECGIRKGDPFSVHAMRKCITSFYQKGIFKDIMVEAYAEEGGVGIQYTFVGKLKVGNVKIKGHDFFSTRRLRSATGLKRGAELTDEMIEEGKGRILNLYRGSGFFDASVQTESVKTGKDQTVDIVIRIHEGERARIGDILFRGDRVWKDEELESMMKLHKGDYYNEREMDLSIKTLERRYINTGYLKALISPPDLLYNEATGEVSVTISIDAGPHVEVLFEGVEAADPEALKKELLIWRDKSTDIAVLDESADRLTQYYRGKGYYFATVTYDISRPEDKHLRIVFKVTEGVPVTIREIGFAGNAYFSDKRLKEYLHVREERFLSEEVLNEDIKEITDLYRSAGFLDVKMTPKITFHEEDKTLSVLITVEEGVQTRISGIRMEGNAAFSAPEIMARIRSREGSPYNESQVTDDLYSIQSFYVQKGYIYSSVDLRTEYSPDKKEVQVRYIIHEDSPVYTGDIYVSGNTFTKEVVIRRELLIKEGDLYSYEKILRSQRQLLMLGIFKSIKLEPMNPEIKEYRKDLSLKVEEGYPGTVEFGFGYGDVERLRGVFEASYRNIAGTGRQISLRTEGISIEQKYNLGYKEPWIFGYQMDGRLNVVDLIEDKRSFDRRTLGLTTGIDKSFSERVKGSLMFQYEDIKTSNVSAGAILTPEDIGKEKVVTFNPSLIIDRRDDPFNPTRGAFYSLTFREAARVLGSRLQFAKVNLHSSFFHSPVRRVVLAFSIRGGIAWNFGESTEVPIWERYFAGGRSTVRGYDQDSIGAPEGGDKMVILNGEIRLPLFKGLGLVTFVDSGNVWTRMEDFKPLVLRTTAGAGIRYNTPVGPLRLDVGCKLDPEVGEDRCLPHFTLGHAF